MTLEFWLRWTAKQLWRLVAWAIVPFFILFAKKTEHPWNHKDGVQYRKLPDCLAWAGTPDMHLPGDLRIEKVWWIYKHLGWFAAAWYWIGYRNVGHGIMWPLGKKVTTPIWFMTDFEKERYGVWKEVKKVGFLYIHIGYKTPIDPYYKGERQVFWALPRVSIRFKP